MAIQIISLIIVGFIVVYFMRKEQVKQDDYFGKKIKFTKKEQTILDHYKSIYKAVPNDKRLPNIKRNKFELEDIALTATAMIYDNSIPTTEEKEKIKIGDLVKLLFTDKGGSVERMWVEVLEKENDIFKGLLRNNAIEISDLNEGKVLYFHSNHIYDIDHET
ncbi:MAG: DUF2314 domain-containing protein [Bacteroidetes bacterium]|jgi:hypothetical protein|nr:DUF2314 domain-containing protein [Bacteroidota bacterium]